METVKARIGLAETTLVVDANGAYRAQEVLHIDNAASSFSKFACPRAPTLDRQGGRRARQADAVAGAADPRRVRIPLIKTAPGDRLRGGVEIWRQDAGHPRVATSSFR